MERLARIFKEAIEMELEGRQVYLDAAERTSDLVLKTVLEELARDELSHSEMITRFYEALEKHQGWPEPDDRSERHTDLPKRLHAIIDETAGALKGRNGYHDIYRIASDMERRSRDFYLEQENAAEDRRVVELFGFLARVEDAHMKALTLLAQEEK